jgi:hypothetical protein
MRKIAVNKQFGGFGLSRAAILRARELSGLPRWGETHIVGDTWEEDGTPVEEDYDSITGISRDDPILLQVLSELGADADGRFASIVVLEIPESHYWEIDDYDGMESLVHSESPILHD